MGFKPLGEAAAPAESGGFRPLEAGRSYAAPLPEDDHAPLDLTNEELDALPAQLTRDWTPTRPPQVNLKSEIERRLFDIGKGAVNFLDWPARGAAAVPLAVAEAIKTPGYNWPRDFPESLSTFTESGHLPYTGPADVPVGGGEKIPIGAVPEHALGALFQTGGENIAKRTEQLREAGYLSPGAAAAFETTGNAIMLALGGRVGKRGGEARTGREVSTVVRPQEAPAPSPIEEWLARKAQERTGPIQDVSEVGGVPVGQNLITKGVQNAIEARKLEARDRGQYPRAAPLVQTERVTGNLPARVDAGRAEAGGGDRIQSSAPEQIAYARYPDLTPEERAIETRTGEYVTQHTDEAIAEYKKRFGNVISTDNARELSADYLKDRTQSVAVHEPFSALMKEIYRRDLQEPAPEGKENAVVFTAGGTGAGKSHAIYQNGETASLASRAQIVYDTNMNRYDSAKTKIDQALDAGKRAVILYVYRDPVTALVGQPGIHGVIQRAIGQKEKYGSGRTVPLSEHANTHIGSRDAIERLAREYEGNPMVSVYALHNKEPGVKPPVESFTELPKHGYNELYGRLQTALKQEHAAGRVPEEIYNGIAREAPRPGAGVREGDLGPSARESLKAAQREPEAALVGVEAPKRLAEDAPAQSEYLNREAKALGFPDADALLKAKPREFNRLAEEWRNQHELTVGTNREMHALDRISVSLEEPTGEIAKAIEKKFEPDVYLQRYQRQLIPKERMVIAAAVRDVISAGMPEHALEATKGFAASLSGTDASFNLENRTVSVRDILDIPDKVVRGWIAHEMTHALDGEGAFPAKSYKEMFISADSPRLEVWQGAGIWGLEGKGDISREIVGKWDVAKNPELWKFFSYPLGMSFPEGLMRVELFAQASRLYLVNPELLKKELPITYSVMKEIYDNAGTSLEETRAAIRTALQAPGAAASHAEVRGRTTGQPPEATGRSSIERSPGERVVGVEARPEHGGRPPDETKRVVGVQGPNPHWDIDQPGLIDNLTRQWQNNQIDLKKVQEAIERFGGVIKERGNAYLAEELYRDRVTSRIKRAFKNGIEPILKDIKDAKLTVDETGKYLWARHAPERNAQMEKINPGEKGLSGLSDAEAAAILASFPAAKRAALDRIGEKIDTLTAATRQILVKNGLEEPSTIAAWEGAYKHYVPLFRDLDESGTGRGFQVVGPESKRATGSKREAQAVLAAVIAQHERAIVRVEKAEVGRALIRLAEEFPNPDFWKVDQPPMKKTVNPTTGLVQAGVDPMYRQRDDVFIVKETDPSGKVVERVLAFNPKNERAVKLAAVMKNLDIVQLGAVTKAVGKVTRIFANLATSWNPGFWATNFVRDVQTAGVNLQSTPLRGRAPQVFANIPRALGGILSAEFADGKGKWATAYRQFEMEGGKMEWASIFNDLVERSEDLANQIKASQRGNINPAKWGSLAVDVIEKTNSAIENMTRLATFVEGVDRGLSPKQSASLAKNLTVNFRRKGNQSTATGAWYMFFNANVQGTARMIAGIAKSRRAQAIVGTMVAFGAALELVNRMIGEQNLDTEGNNPYELIPEDVRSKNMIFMLKGGKKASLPLAYGFSVFHNAGRMLMEQVLTAGGSKLVTERKKPLEVGWNFAKVLIDSFMPLGNTTTPAQFIAPTVLDPAVQYAENKTWYGGPIRPEPQTFGPATPNYKLYFRDTSDMAKDMTKWLSDITGGDEVQGGSIDISPTTVTHILGSITGGAGQFGMGVFDFTNHMVNRVAGKETPEDLSWRKVPFVGKFYGEVDDRDKAAKFYRLRSEAMDVWKKMETYRKSGDYDKASQIEEENPALAAMARELVSKPFKKEMRGFREEFKTVLDLPRDERQRERDRLKAEEVSTMARAISAYNEAARENR